LRDCVAEEGLRKGFWGEIGYGNCNCKS